MKEIGLQYYNCGDNLLIDEIVNQLEFIRHKARAKHYEKSKQCIQILEKTKSYQSVPRISIPDQEWINSSCCAKIVTNKCLVCKKEITVLLENEEAVCVANLNDFRHSCKQKDVFNVPAEAEDSESYEFCCENQRTTDESKTSFPTEENDPQAANSMNDYILKDECRRLLTGNNYHPPVFPRNLSHDHQKINLTSFICKSNTTLALIAVDSLQFFHIAEGLGIDILKKKDKTAVAIVDPVVSY